MKALVKKYKGAGNWEVVERKEPSINDDQVKIKVEYIGVCGSDVHTYEGHYNYDREDLVIGHEFSGVLVDVGKNVEFLKIGDRVTSETTFEVCGECEFCKRKEYNLCSLRKGLGTQQDGACAEYVIARGKSIHKLPDKLTLKEAAITEAAACAYHAVMKSKPEENTIALVMGPGPIGLLVSQVLMSFNIKVILVGLNKDKSKLDLAENVFNIHRTVDVQNESLSEIIKYETDGRGVDYCFECSGAEVAFNTGIEFLKKKGKFIQVGIFPKDEINANLKNILQKELEIVGSRSQNYHDWEPTLKLMSEKFIQADKMISHELTIKEWEKAYNLIKSGDAIKIVLRPV